MLWRISQRLHAIAWGREILPPFCCEVVAVLLRGGFTSM
jgi:hypothetical protein